LESSSSDSKLKHLKDESSIIESAHNSNTTVPSKKRSQFPF
jgi:hypothetical protein